MDSGSSCARYKILTAWLLREECRKRIAAEADKKKKGDLRKATYFLGWLIKLAVEDKIEALMDRHQPDSPEPSAKDAFEMAVVRVWHRGSAPR